MVNLTLITIIEQTKPISISSWCSIRFHFNSSIEYFEPKLNIPSGENVQDFVKTCSILHSTLTPLTKVSRGNSFNPLPHEFAKLFVKSHNIQLISLARRREKMKTPRELLINWREIFPELEASLENFARNSKNLKILGKRKFQVSSEGLLNNFIKKIRSSQFFGVLAKIFY